MIHRRTLLRGAVLGVILDGGLTIAGVLGGHSIPQRTASPPAPETETGVRTGISTGIAAQSEPWHAQPGPGDPPTGIAEHATATKLRPFRPANPAPSRPPRHGGQ